MVVVVGFHNLSTYFLPCHPWVSGMVCLTKSLSLASVPDCFCIQQGHIACSLPKERTHLKPRNWQRCSGPRTRHSSMHPNFPSPHSSIHSPIASLGADSGADCDTHGLCVHPSISLLYCSFGSCWPCRDLQTCRSWLGRRAFWWASSSPVPGSGS